MQNNIERIIA
jgi:hypothetical protein